MRGSAPSIKTVVSRAMRLLAVCYVVTQFSYDDVLELVLEAGKSFRLNHIQLWTAGSDNVGMAEDCCTVTKADYRFRGVCMRSPTRVELGEVRNLSVWNNLDGDIEWLNIARS